MTKKRPTNSQIQSMLFSVMALVIFGSVGFILLRTIEPNPRRVNHNLPPSDNEPAPATDSFIITPEDDISVPVGWKRYVNLEQKYALLYPEKWNVTEEPQVSTCFNEISRNQNTYELTGAEFCVSVVGTSDALYAQLLSRQIGEKWIESENQEIHFLGKIINSPLDSKTITLTTLDAQQSPINYAQMMFVSQEGREPLNLHSTHPDPGKYVVFENEFNQMRSSFEFIK